MAPADSLAALAAALLGVSPTTTTSPTPPTPPTTMTTRTTTTTNKLVQTFVSVITATAATRTTLGASSTTASTTTPSATTAFPSAPCYPGPCTNDMPVTFGPLEGDNARAVCTWGSAAFAGAFGLLALAHLVQGAHYRWRPATAAVVGGLAALAGYALQATGARDGDNVAPYLLATSFALLQIAPLCITLYAYLVLTKLAHTRFLPAHDSLDRQEGQGTRVWPSNGRWLAHWSVVALLAGAAAAQAVAVAVLVFCGLTTLPVAHALLGAADLVWAAGLAAQAAVVLVLLAAVTHTFATLPPARAGGQQERAASGAVPALSLPPRRRLQVLWLLVTTYAVLALLTLRLVYRIVAAVRASQGRPRPSADAQQVYALALEAAPTCLALALLNVVHAGWALPVNRPAHLRAEEAEPPSGRLSRQTTGREDNVGVADDVGGPGDAPRGVHFSAPPALTPAQILVQQRAIIQRQRQQQRQQWQRQWQMHMHQPRPPPSLSAMSPVEALARSSLSASLSVSLPRESVAGRDVGGAEGEDGVDTEAVEAEARRPSRLGRLSMDNFILFRFLNAPSRSASRGMTASTRSRRSGRSGRSRRTPHSHSTPSQGDSALADDPFAGFDYTYEGDASRRDDDNVDAESRRTCDSPDEKRGRAWP